jgi:hypothetical protein
MHRECKREPTGANVHFHSRQAAAVATMTEYGDNETSDVRRTTRRVY